MPLFRLLSCSLLITFLQKISYDEFCRSWENQINPSLLFMFLLSFSSWILMVVSCFNVMDFEESETASIRLWFLLQRARLKPSKLAPLLHAPANAPSPLLWGVFANDGVSECPRGSKRRGHEFYYSAEGKGTPAVELPNFQHLKFWTRRPVIRKWLTL